jgi:hypothetical protein
VCAIEQHQLARVECWHCCYCSTTEGKARCLQVVATATLLHRNQRPFPVRPNISAAARLQVRLVIACRLPKLPMPSALHTTSLSCSASAAQAAAAAALPPASATLRVRYGLLTWHDTAATTLNVWAHHWLMCCCCHTCALHRALHLSCLHKQHTFLPRTQLLSPDPMSASVGG